jgi:hypothetical protein
VGVSFWDNVGARAESAKRRGARKVSSRKKSSIRKKSHSRKKTHGTKKSGRKSAKKARR